MAVETIQALRNDMRHLRDKLRTERDELRVQMHLAQAELQDEWEKLEPKWLHLHERVEELGGAAEVTAEEVRAGLSLLGEELADGYKRIRAALGGEG